MIYTVHVRNVATFLGGRKFLHRQNGRIRSIRCSRKWRWSIILLDYTEFGLKAILKVWENTCTVQEEFSTVVMVQRGSGYRTSNFVMMYSDVC